MPGRMPELAVCSGTPTQKTPHTPHPAGGSRVRALLRENCSALSLAPMKTVKRKEGVGQGFTGQSHSLCPHRATVYRPLGPSRPSFRVSRAAAVHAPAPEEVWDGPLLVMGWATPGPH